MRYEVDDFEVDLKGNKIKCRPWTSKQERNYLSAKNSETGLKSAAKMLIFPNIEFKPITIAEFNYLVIQHRKISVGSEVSLSVDCNCGQHLEFEKSVDELTHYLEPNIDNKKIIVDDIEIKLRKIPSKELLLKVLEVTDEDERIFYELLSSIEEITYKGETKKTFLFEELEEFFDTLPSSLFRKILSEFFKVKGHIELFCEVTCPLCQNKFNAIFKDIPSFL